MTRHRRRRALPDWAVIALGLLTFVASAVVAFALGLWLMWAFAWLTFEPPR